MNLFASRTKIEPNIDDYLVQDLVVDSQTTNHAIKRFCQQLVHKRHLPFDFGSGLLPDFDVLIRRKKVEAWLYLGLCKAKSA